MHERPKTVDSRVFETEEAFLQADESVRKRPNFGFVVVDHTGTTHWVWAPSRTLALGLVARKLQVFSAAGYRAVKEVAKMREVEVVAMFAALSNDLKDKIRRQLGCLGS